MHYIRSIYNTPTCFCSTVVSSGYKLNQINGVMSKITNIVEVIRAWGGVQNYSGNITVM